MPDVIKKTPGTLGFAGTNGVVSLKPGANAVSDADWERAKKLPSIQRRLESGDLVVGGVASARLKPPEPDPREVAKAKAVEAAKASAEERAAKVAANKAAKPDKPAAVELPDAVMDAPKDKKAKAKSDAKPEPEFREG